jgi:hypothetical protein
MRPYRTFVTPDTALAGTEKHRCIERIMWHGLVSPDAVNFDTNTECSGDATSFDVDFTASNVHRFLPLFFYVKADTQWYRIDNVQVNQAEVDFSIDGIGMVSWSGFGTVLTQISAPTFTAGATAVREYSTPTVVSGGTVSNTMSRADFIIQKYTALTVVNNLTAESYSVPITGGNLTINNNITYLTPETLGVVNRPIGSFTGSRDISGSVSCYLRTGTASDAGDLMADLLAASSSTTNTFSLTFKAGGNNAPYVQFTMPNATLSLPTMDVQDVLSMNIEFKALGFTGTTTTTATDITAVNDMVVSYFALTETSDTVDLGE